MSKYVVYTVDSARILTYCDSVGGARRSLKAQQKKHPSWNIDWDTKEAYDKNVNIEVETYNMLDPTHKPIKIRLADKGGCCDPATETYHCM